jgi:K+-sensing histidine kinase KdpD
MVCPNSFNTLASIARTAIADTGGVRVAVEDSGPGLASATVERLFEAFYTTKASGLGLWRSICRSIIEAHGGQLWASANVPRGATFQFTMCPIPKLIMSADRSVRVSSDLVEPVYGEPYPVHPDPEISEG